MIWKVTSADGKRWVKWEGVDGYTADPVTDGILGGIAELPVKTASHGPLYIPRENPDQLGTYYKALDLLGADAKVTGTPPLPEVPEAPDDDDRVY